MKGKEPATDAQKHFLGIYTLDIPDNLTRKKAYKRIAKLMKRFG